jgi:hypothetical protein
MTFGDSAMNSENTYKIYVQIWLCSQRHILNTMKCSLFQMMTFIELTPTPDERGNCRCSEKRHFLQPCRPNPALSIELQESALWLVIVKCYLQQSSGHAWKDADSTELLKFRHKHCWQKIWMLKLHFAIPSFPTFQARNYWIYVV